MSRQRRSPVSVALLCFSVLLFAVPMHAFAGINDLPSDPTVTPWASTTTNPGEYTPPTWWRQSWGNSLIPNFNFVIPSFSAPPLVPEDGPALGFIYRVDRSPSSPASETMPAVFADYAGTYIDKFDPSSYDHAFETSWEDPAYGSFMSHVFDMNGILASDPIGLSSTDVGARLPIEGIWWIHYNFFNDSMVATTTLSVPFGIDLTPPLPVSTLVARPYVGFSGTTSGVWFPQTRAVVSWEDKEYDALSGTAAYEIYLNDKLITDDSDTASSTPEYVYHLPHVTNSFTFEDLPGGKNKIMVKPVDRATNVGPGRVVYFYADPDVPTISITSPAEGGLLGKSATYSVNASDSAGLQYVQFYIDGRLVYTDTASPYAVKMDMSAYANGTHQLLAKTKDMYGREVSDTHSFTLDKTPPTITSLSDSPDPFYPVMQDGYKDKTYVSFYTSEPGYAYVYFYEGTRVVAAKSRPVSAAGKVGFDWDGTWNMTSDTASTNNYTYAYRVVMIDKAGNQTWSGLGYTTMRDYEIVRVAPNAVRVIPR